jgi:hypothetical protein
MAKIPIRHKKFRGGKSLEDCVPQPINQR